jgi:hypothetical protein
MNDAARQTELYKGIWAQDQDYGTAQRDVWDTVLNRIAPHMRRVLPSLARARVIDFGAGDARFLKCMWSNCLLGYGVGVDVYEPEYKPEWLSWIKEPMWLTHGPCVDYAISTDALEHLPPARVNDTLQAIANSAPHGFLRISLKEDRYGAARGLHLHESVFSSDEWLRRLRVAGIWPTSYRVYIASAGGFEEALEVWF